MGRTLARTALALFLIVAGAGHFIATETFLAQTPTFLPWRTAIVYVSGVVELGLGAALLITLRWRAELGWIVAAFFVAVLPGNLYQAIAGIDAFGLDSATARWTRLLFQPLLVGWALWSTGAWEARRTVFRSRRG